MLIKYNKKELEKYDGDYSKEGEKLYIHAKHTEELDLIENTKSSLPKMLLSVDMLANETSYSYSSATRNKYKAKVSR